MRNVPSDGHQEPYVAATERHLWRYRLFEAIRQSRRYRNIVAQDLRILWKAAILEAGPDEVDTLGRPLHARAVHGLRARAEHDPSRTALRGYLAEVDEFSTDVLRLTSGGKPTRWAAEFIHVDVEPRAARRDHRLPGMPQWSSFFGGSGYEAVPSDTEPWNFFYEGMRVVVSPSEGRVQLGSGLGDLPPIDETVIPAGRLDRFDEWTDLRKAAYAMVDTLIDGLKEQYESSYPQRRPSTDERLIEDVSVFSAYLLAHKRPIDRAESERLRRFASMIGADYPAHNK